MTKNDRLAEIEHLYHEAFRAYGTVALWSYRACRQPTPEDAMAVTRALRTHGGMDGRRLAERIESLCRAVD